MPGAARCRENSAAGGTLRELALATGDVIVFIWRLRRAHGDGGRGGEAAGSTSASDIEVGLMPGSGVGALRSVAGGVGQVTI